MRASAAGRRVLLVLLLAVLAMAAVPAIAQGYAAQSRAAALGGLTHDTPATQHDLRDWLRLPVAARHALSTSAPDSWWAVCAHTTGTWALLSRPLAGGVADTTVAIGVAAVGMLLGPGTILAFTYVALG